MADTYTNKSKKLLEDVEKFIKKCGGNPDMSTFDTPLDEAVVFAKWAGSATIGAKQKHRFRIHSTRRAGATEFTDRMAVGHLLLPKKNELPGEVTGELIPLEIEGYFSNTGNSVVIRSLTPVDADEAGLRAKMDELYEDKEHASESFGTLVYQLRSHSFTGHFERDGRRVDVTFRDTGPSEIDAGCKNLEKFFDPADDVAADLKELVRNHESFEANASKGASPELSHVWLADTAVTVNFSAPGIGIAYARAVLRDGEFKFRRVDKITGPDDHAVA